MGVGLAYAEHEMDHLRETQAAFIAKTQTHISNMVVMP